MAELHLTRGGGGMERSAAIVPRPFVDPTSWHFLFFFWGVVTRKTVSQILGFSIKKPQHDSEMWKSSEPPWRTAGAFVSSKTSPQFHWIKYTRHYSQVSSILVNGQGTSGLFQFAFWNRSGKKGFPTRGTFWNRLQFNVWYQTKVE